jgi:hypothetical protein
VNNGQDHSIAVTVAHVQAVTSTWDEFICGLIIETLEAAVAEVAPELIELDILEGYDMNIACQDVLGALTESG